MLLYFSCVNSVAVLQPHNLLCLRDLMFCPFLLTAYRTHIGPYPTLLPPGPDLPSFARGELLAGNIFSFVGVGNSTYFPHLIFEIVLKVSYTVF